MKRKYDQHQHEQQQQDNTSSLPLPLPACAPNAPAKETVPVNGPSKGALESGPPKEILLQKDLDGVMGGRDVGASIQAAEIYHSNYQFRQAYETYTTIAPADPTGHSYFRLAQLLYFGHVPKDTPKAMQYFHQALPLLTLAKSLQDPMIMCDIGFYYERGIGVEKDIQLALQHYRFGTERYYGRSFNNLGLLFGNTRNQPHYDPKLSFLYFDLSAKVGNSKGLYYVGLLYKKGEVVDLDYGTAVEYFKKSAEMGNLKAMWSLAKMYSFGYGVEKNKRDAFRYLKLSGDEGYGRAQYRLYKGYLRGIKGVVERDRGEAVRYLGLAAEQGD